MAVAAAKAAVTVSLTISRKLGRPATPVRTQTIADVATRTEQALAAAANQGNAIQVIRGKSGPAVTFRLSPLGMKGVTQI